MKTIRRNIFETNSSSTHAIAIPKEVDREEYSLMDNYDHNYGFGREECRLVSDWDEKLAYIYIILKDYKEWNKDSESFYKRQHNITPEDIKSFKERVNSIYKEVYKIVEYKPYGNDSKPNNIFKDVDKKEAKGDFYVDHSEDFDTNGFLDKILTDDDFLKRFIFNRKSYITVGGDEYRGYNIKTIGFENDYESKYINKGTEKKPEYEDIGEFWDKLKEYSKPEWKLSDDFAVGNDEYNRYMQLLMPSIFKGYIGAINVDNEYLMKQDIQLFCSKIFPTIVARWQEDFKKEIIKEIKKEIKKSVKTTKKEI